MECNYDNKFTTFSNGNKNCFINCPYYFYKNSSSYFCRKNNSCPNKYQFEIISIKQCVGICQIGLILKEECKLNFEENMNDKNIIEIKNEKA